MFPSILPLEADKTVSGKVFSFEIVRAGGTFVSYRRVATNMQEWNDCLECPEFEHCYQLCMGRLALEAAIEG
jgi:deferrochelatase/peroxidase EfeB